MTPFFLPHAVVAATIVASLLEQPWAFTLPTWAFLGGLAIDQVFTTRVHDTLVPHAGRRSWRLLLYTWAPLHAAAVLCGLEEVARLQRDGAGPGGSFMTIVVGTGMVGGTLGGAIAHEFMHAPRALDRRIGAALMSLVSYGHFAIGHVAGHHRWVGTPQDPATARRGESLYVFLARSFAGGAVQAWSAERGRLRRRGRRTWSLENRLLQIIGWQVLLYAGVFAAAGSAGVAFFALQGLVAASLLEVMNYIMHYGLARGRLPSGRLEPVRPWCSWNSRHLATTYLLCGIGLHSFHHCRPSKPFIRLGLPPTAPELPGGLFAMFVLAWFPPLWWSVMDPLVDFWMRRHSAPAAPVMSTTRGSQ